MFLKAWKEAAEEVREEVPNPDAYYVEQLKNLGMTVIEVDKSEFNKLAEPVNQEFDKTAWQNGLRQKIMAL